MYLRDIILVHNSSVKKGKDINLNDDIKQLCEKLYNTLNNYYHKNANK